MNVTEAAFNQALENCNFGKDRSVSDLITSSHTDVYFNDIIMEKQMENDGAYSYFSGFFGVETWEDGMGMDEIREYSTPSYIPISNEYFVEKMKPCIGSANMDQCDWDTCEIPEGGRGTLPPFTFYEWGLETPRTCIANIRHIKQFEYWAAKRIEERYRADEQIMNMFYTMMGWKTAGHKVVLEYDLDPSTGKRTPKISNNPRNPFRGFSHNYMQDFFPAVDDPSNIGPLDIGVLENLARTWGHNGGGHHVATGSRGEKIYEMWFNDDWFLTEGHRNVEYIEKIRRYMPGKEFAGYSLDTSEREVIGNFAMRTMPHLPRMVVNEVDGGLLPIDTHVGVDIEVGKEYLLSPEWQNAPFSMAMMPSPDQGTIMVRPDLNQSGDGIPILPITGKGEWRFRNDYDKDCNKKLNKPYSENHYEMGMRMDNPDSAMAVIHRNRVFHSQSENFCDLAEIISKVPTEVCNDSIGVGCRGGKIPHQASVTTIEYGTRVHCTSEACGNQSGPTWIYKVQVERKANKKGFNSLDCACGSTVLLQIGDAVGEVDREIEGVVIDDAQGYPEGIYLIRTNEQLADAECIKTVACQDNTPTSGEVISAQDADENTGNFTVVLDSPVVAVPNAAASVEYFDADGNSLGTENAQIVSGDINTQRYVVDLTGTSDSTMEKFDNGTSVVDAARVVVTVL